MEESKEARINRLVQHNRIYQEAVKAQEYLNLVIPLLRQECYSAIEKSKPDELLTHQAFLIALKRLEEKHQMHLADGPKKLEELRKIREGE